MKQLSSLSRLLVWAVLVAVAAVPAQVEPLRSTKPVEILWDTWGVPHIFAQDTPGLFRAFGWAQMESHGDLILRLYGQARGRGAEYWGERYLESDRWVRINGIPERGRAWYEAQTAEFRRLIDSFVIGINEYAGKHADKLNPEVRVVLPVTAHDVMAHTHRVIHFTFVSNPGTVGASMRQLGEMGSNAWAISPSRSESGKAMLLANPHLPWSDLFLFYEAQLVAPGVDIYGATLVGFPVMGIAFNDHLGWTHTVNTYDGQDHFVLKLVEGGYEWEGKPSGFESHEQTIKVRTDGGVREEKLTVKRSVHGPVIAERGQHAVALRVAGLDRPRMLEQWWKMSTAKNLSEFENALRTHHLPMFNVIYADRDGRIMYLFNGLVPARPKGDWAYWSRGVAGGTAETLWKEYLPFSDLPKLIDPGTGWVQNANDPPWTSTIPQTLAAERFPSYVAPRFMHFRAQRSARMLLEDEKISFDEMIAYKHSSRMEMADRLLDDLIPAAKEKGTELARKAAAVLSAWDRNADRDSRGAVLFSLWAQEMGLIDNMDSKAFAVAWDGGKPTSTPDGLADPAGAVKALESAATKTEQAYGSLDVAWGEVFRLRHAGRDLPGNGGPGGLGIFRVVGYAPVGSGRFQAAGGDSYVAAIEFTNPPRARVLMSYGNSSQPGSKHFGDQLELFAKKEMRTAWRSRKEIESNLESRTALK